MSSSHLAIKDLSVVDAGTASDLHTPLNVALKELSTRRKNAVLKELVSDHLGDTAQDVLRKFRTPRAVFFRQVGTPTHEMLRFLKIAKASHLKPLILEFHGDKFVGAHNPYKKALGKMPVYQHTGKDGVDNMQNFTVVDFPVYDGHPFRDVRTIHGDSLIAFHHRLLKKVGKIDPRSACIDGTNWFNAVGGHAGQYYEHVFSLLVRDGILFENYLADGEESEFVKNIVRPAFEQTRARYGVSPLIVKFIPKEEEARKFWDAYPSKIAKLLTRERTVTRVAEKK